MIFINLSWEGLQGSLGYQTSHPQSDAHKHASLPGDFSKLAGPHGSLQFSTCSRTTCPPASLLAQAPYSLHPCLSTLQPWQGGGAPAASDLLVDATLGLQLQESQRAVLTYQVRARSPAPPSPALSCRLPALAQRPRLAARALVAAMQAKQRRSEREWLRPAAVALARASARSTCRAPAVAAGSAAQGPTPAPAAHQRGLAGQGLGRRTRTPTDSWCSGRRGS